MTDTQRLKDKLTNLRLKGMLQQLDTTLEQAVQKNLNVVATLGLLADLELEHRWHNAIHLRWRQSALTKNSRLVSSTSITINPERSKKLASWRCAPSTSSPPIVMSFSLATLVQAKPS